MGHFDDMSRLPVRQTSPVWRPKRQNPNVGASKRVGLNVRDKVAEKDLAVPDISVPSTRRPSPKVGEGTTPECQMFDMSSRSTHRPLGSVCVIVLMHQRANLWLMAFALVT
jgi:hypothetical protein